ncbi:DUF1538 domain-containing protein [Anaerofilum sp. BX8]|uniref:DUF1538 domain-containing protein n=1 Tax=Anaerofilum hominis TaxID=2763016 RepID=A0A923KV28_9FIRM|nr:DUF1538 domain-containing protein [Anaerofilum hominis]MBC5580341.1 DUF1538 domain-containing protein [Anaerofilum hominis]
MNKILKEKIREAVASVLPITGIVLVLSVTVAPMPLGTLMMFLAGALLLVVGVGFFSLGADISMMPLGEAMGAGLGGSRRWPLAALVSLALGALITVAEPDLQVLANQVPAIPDEVLIFTVAAGVGAFLVLALLRTRRGWPLSRLLAIFYPLVFLLAFLAPGDFIAVAFDSGGVTTGPITVPFLMALGVGMASLLGQRQSREDSFGLVALCSIGPILAVLLLGICYDPSTANYAGIAVPDVFTTKDVARQFAAGLPAYAEEVGLALLPIAAVFALFQLISRSLHRRQLAQAGVGLVYTFLGLVLFLTGVNVGFMPAGHYLGSELAASPLRWLLLPVGFLVGWFIVTAEPAVHVLTHQVEEISGGAISRRAMLRSLSVGVAASVTIAMLRVLTGVSIFWFLIPGYALALGLMRFVPPIFTGIAFDSGGVASGPMTATFLLPFAMGACESLGGNILTDAFGVVAMVAMTPLVTIQLMGFAYSRRSKRLAAQADGDDIVEYDCGEVQYE